MFCGRSRRDEKQTVTGSVVMKKEDTGCTAVCASLIDRILDFLGRGVSLQLISADQQESGEVGKAAYLENRETAEDITYDIKFEWEERLGYPGAFIVKSHHRSEFYLKTVTLKDVPGHDRVHFECNSWVYPTYRYKFPRIFFSNKTYLPQDTPGPLRKYREDELTILRGNGTGELKEWDRVYDYAYYNDLGMPDKGSDYARPTLGGSRDYPYPRRGRTGRKPSKADPNAESRLPLLLSLEIYVPRDERFGHLKFKGFLADALKAIAQILVPELESVTDKTPNEFDTFEDTLHLYEGGFKLPKNIFNKLKDCIPWAMVKERPRTDGQGLLKLLMPDGQGLLKLPMPDVIKVDKTAWRTDEEFAREMLAGINPLVIQSLQEFPPRSKLDPSTYGDQNSRISKEDIEKNMDGISTDQAIKENRLFVLDHHDALMTYLIRVNSTNTKTYATRTVLFLKSDGTLRPLAIELSLPHPEGYKHGAVSQVYTPAEQGVEGSIWQLAKAFAAVNDSGYHQLISHWLHTHAVIEPFIIASNRQLSVLHPIYKLLHPHFRYTMNINALSRQILINAGGILERTVYLDRYSMEISSAIYKNWVLTEQAVPVDLLKRGMAVKDENYPHGLRLMIEDYPYAVDGLEIWSAIETWVNEYCSFYYPNDELMQGDIELQSWWTKIRNEGHGDKKDEPWWTEMKSKDDLIRTCTTIIWVASALHAAVNFGQYGYAGYAPNRPTISRQFIPEPGTSEYAQLESNPDGFFLKTITAQLQTLIGVGLIELLSIHSTDEIYLGKRETSEWTTDAEPLAAFERFKSRLIEIENGITERNNDQRLKNRLGPVKLPYTLLFPSTSDNSKEAGITGKGIPNSITI